MAQRNAASVRLDAENPWPGLATYDESGHGFFYGREKETRDLFDLVERGLVTVLHGKSGLGKSSLINAGLCNELRRTDRRNLPIHITLKFTGPTLEAELPDDFLVQQLKDDLTVQLREERIDARPPRREETLYEYFHQRDLEFWDERNRPLTLVLILDQFEEIFTLGARDEKASVRTERLLQELAALFRRVHTAPVAERFRADPARLSACELDKRQYKCVISLREDFLPHLENRPDVLPVVTRQTMRLVEMSREQALDVVVHPGGHLIVPGVAEKIVAFVSAPSRRETSGGARLEPTPTRGVDPAILSLVCRQLNEQRKAAAEAHPDTPALIEASQLAEGHAEKIILDYYIDSLRGREALQRFIESELVSVDGHRTPLPEQDAIVRHRVPKSDVNDAIEERILVREIENGVPWLRLSHDRLAEVACKMRTGREREEERIEAEKRQREATEKQFEAEAKQRDAEEKQLAAEKEKHAAVRRERIAKRRMVYACVFAAIATAALIAAVLSWGWAKAEKNRADDNAREAHKSSLIALQNENKANKAQWISNLNFASVKGDPGLAAAYTCRAWLSDPSSSVTTGRLVSSLVHQEWLLPVAHLSGGGAGLKSAAWSPRTGEMICVARGKELTLRDRSLQLIETFTFPAEISAVLFSPDEQFIAIGLKDGGVQVRKTNKNDREVVLDAAGIDGAVKFFRFSPDSTRLLAVKLTKSFGRITDETLGRIWTLAEKDNAEGRRLVTHSRIVDADFSLDGQYLVVAKSNSTGIWDAATGVEIEGVEEVSHGSPVSMIKVRPTPWDEPDWIIYATGVDDASLWMNVFVPKTKVLFGGSLSSGTQSRASGVTALQWSPDGQEVLAAHDDGSVVDLSLTVALSRIGDAAGKKLTTSDLNVTPYYEVPRGGPAVEGMSFSRDGQRLIACLADGQVRFLPLSYGSLAARADSPAPISVTGGVSNATVSPDGGSVLVAGRAGQVDLLSLHRHKALPLWIDAAETIKAFTYCPKSKRILALTGNTLQEWDPATGKPQTSYEVGPMDQLAFDCNTATIVVASRAYNAQKFSLWNRNTEQEICKSTEHASGITDLRFSPASERLVSVDSEGIHLWRWNASAAELKPLHKQPLLVQKEKDGTSRPDVLRFSNSGASLFASVAGHWRVWEITRDDQLADYIQTESDFISDAAFSEDSHCLALAVGRQIKVLKFTKPSEFAYDTLTVPLPIEASTVEFDKTGSAIATASPDGTVRIFEISSGREKVAPLRHSKPVQHLVFSADGQRLLTVEAENVHLWDLQTGLELMSPMLHPALVDQAEFIDNEGSVMTRCGNKLGIWQLTARIGEDKRSRQLMERIVTAYSGYEFNTNGIPQAVNSRFDLLNSVRAEKDLPQGVISWLAWRDDKLLDRPISPGQGETFLEYFEHLLADGSDAAAAEAKWISAGHASLQKRIEPRQK